MLIAGYLLLAHSLYGQVVLNGHTRDANVVACSNDGKLIVSGGDDGATILWDVAGRAQKASAKGDAVGAVALSPDGSRIASGERYKKVKLLDGSGKELKALEGHDAPVIAVGFSADSKVLYSFSLDGGLRSWDAATGAATGVPQKTVDSYTSAAFSGDGKFLLSGTSGGTVRMYNLATKKEMWKKTGNSPIRAVAISADGKSLAVALNDATVRLLDPSGTELGSVPAVEANGLAFSAGGKRLAAAGHDGLVHTIAVESKTLVAKLKGHDRSVRAVCFSPDGASVVSVSFDNTVRIWPIS